VLPKTLTPAEAAAQLKSQGVDATALQTLVIPQLDSADRNEVLSILSKTVKLNYSVDVDTRMLIDKRTGSIVDLKNITQTIYVSPDVAGIGRVQLILADQKYASKPAVATAAQVLNKLVTNPPRLKAFSYSYSQTPASVADIAKYAKSKGDQIDLAKKTVPLLLLVVGVVVLVIGVVLIVVTRRRGRTQISQAPQQAP
jgi:hypothetical protein